MAALEIRAAEQLASRYAAQDARDRELLARRFTGVEWDDACREYCGYLNGQPTVWGRSYGEADTRLREQIP